MFQYYDRPINWVKSPFCLSKEVELLCGWRWNMSNSCSILIYETISFSSNDFEECVHTIYPIKTPRYITQRIPDWRWRSITKIHIVLYLASHLFFMTQKCALKGLPVPTLCWVPCDYKLIVWRLALVFLSTEVQMTAA